MLVIKKDNFVDKNRLMITIPSIRSLNKHAVDLACYKRRKRSDIMCLAETQFQQDLSYILEEFNMICSNNCDKFWSIVCGFRNNIDSRHLQLLSNYLF